MRATAGKTLLINVKCNFFKLTLFYLKLSRASERREPQSTSKTLNQFSINPKHKSGLFFTCHQVFASWWMGLFVTYGFLLRNCSCFFFFLCSHPMTAEVNAERGDMWRSVWRETQSDRQLRPSQALPGQARPGQARAGPDCAEMKGGDTMKCYGMMALSRQPADTALSRYNFPNGLHQTPRLRENLWTGFLHFHISIFSWSSVCQCLTCHW